MISIIVGLRMVYNDRLLLDSTITFLLFIAEHDLSQNSPKMDKQVEQTTSSNAKTRLSDAV